MSVESEFRQVLGEMEVWLQYGTTVNFAPTRGGSEGYGRPPGDENPAHLVWREKWDRANPLDYERLLEEAREYLAGALHQKRVEVVPETQAELEARVVSEGDGWSVPDTARHCRCTETFVRKARMRAVAAAAESKIDEAERAKQLANDGFSERQIRMILNCGGSKIKRLLAA